MRDTVMRGVLAGLMAGIPGYILDQVEHKKGLTDMTFPQFSATLLMNKKQTKNIHGRIMGNVINGLGLALSGVSISYILKKTGRDYALFKGVGIGLLQGVLLGGIWPRIGLVEKPKMARSYTFGLINHIIFGSLCGYLVSKIQRQD